MSGYARNRNLFGYVPPTAAEFAAKYGGPEPTPFDKSKERDRLCLVQFELDASGSMMPEIPNLIDAINTIAIPVFQGVSKSLQTRVGLRIGCDLFSEEARRSMTKYKIYKPKA